MAETAQKDGFHFRNWYRHSCSCEYDNKLSARFEHTNEQKKEQKKKKWNAAHMKALEESNRISQPTHIAIA